MQNSNDMDCRVVGSIVDDVLARTNFPPVEKVLWAGFAEIWELSKLSHFADEEINVAVSLL